MRFTTLATVAALAVLPTIAANAATVRFNFNTTTAPQSYFNSEYLKDGQVLTPDVGDATQKATLSISDPINTGSAFQLEDGPAVNFGPGLVLQAIQDSESIFTMTFARPIFSIGFDFSVIPNAFPAPPVDLNTLVVSAYATSGSSAPLASNSSGGGLYNSTYGEYFGHLTLSSAFSFTTVSFGLSDTTMQDTFALDNIDASDDLIPVPEPGTIALGFALGLPAMWRLRKSRKSRSK